MTNIMGPQEEMYKNRDTTTLRLRKNLLSQLEHKNCPNIETVLTLLNTSHNYKGDLHQILLETFEK